MVGLWNRSNKSYGKCAMREEDRGSYGTADDEDNFGCVSIGRWS